jgi:hypothetical protein
MESSGYRAVEGAAENLVGAAQVHSIAEGGGVSRRGHLHPDDLHAVATAFDAAAQTAADWLRTGGLGGPDKPVAVVKNTL